MCDAFHKVLFAVEEHQEGWNHVQGRSGKGQADIAFIDFDQENG